MENGWQEAELEENIRKGINNDGMQQKDQNKLGICFNKYLNVKKNNL